MSLGLTASHFTYKLWTSLASDLRLVSVATRPAWRTKNKSQTCHGRTADKPRTHDGQTMDELRTSLGQTTDKPRTCYGRTTSNIRTCRGLTTNGVRMRSAGCIEDTFLRTLSYATKLYRCTRPVALPAARDSTSATVTWLKSCSMECLRQEAATAKSIAACGFFPVASA